MSVEAPAETREPQADPYANPPKVCDLIMKGGITSGVIYPSAVCELAKVYAFKNVGGASAGAIAAAAAAAAEHGRLRGRQRPEGKIGFQELEDLPGWLAKNLGRLFQPDPPTRPVFNVLLAALESEEGALGKLAAVLQAGVLNFPSGALMGMALGAPLVVIFVLTLLYAPDGAQWLVLVGAVGLFYTLLLMMLFGALGVAVQLVRRVVAVVPNNFYGICSGCDPSADDDPSPPLVRAQVLPLTNWLADELDQLAGLPPGTPLTFGDLWSAAGDAADGTTKAINLEMMTTNLTFGRPYRLPFESRQFFYSPEEFRKLFPKRVVDWMVAHTPVPRTGNEAQQQEHVERWQQVFKRQGILPLPDPADFPVVVATRMSLSFPLLISAVPLYAADWDRRDNAEAKKLGKPSVYEKCWFSDGGISSNFPIHFFDQVLPRWPTFGINLRELSDMDAARIRDERLAQSSSAAGGDTAEGAEFVKLVNSNNEGLEDLWDRFDDNSDAGRLTGFLNSIVNTMYNWADNAQTRVPGYRDRIVHVCHTKKEGGLNLNMSEESIHALSERGRLAGERLRKRFTGEDGSALSWDNHRWVRYRSTMSLIEKMLKELASVYRNPLPGDKTYEELIMRRAVDPPNSYRWRPWRRRDFALKATKRLARLSARWERSGEVFEEGNFIDGAPRPTPEMQIKPRV